MEHYQMSFLAPLSDLELSTDLQAVYITQNNGKVKVIDVGYPQRILDRVALCRVLLRGDGKQVLE